VSATDVDWFDLAVVVEHLSRGEHMLESTGPGGPDEQLQRLAVILRPYMDQVRRLFAAADYALAEEDLNRIGRRREQEIWHQQRN
jgi:hypothetical protein